MKILKYLKIDTFLLMLLLMMLAATLFPAQGEAKTFFKYLTTAAIALLFFMHGAKLSRESILAGIRHWRLHLLVLSSTFVLFPLIGMAMRPLSPWLMEPEIYQGFLYLCALPATVQSAIAFTSLARGNLAAAVCSASASSLLGVFVSPLLVGMLMSTQGDMDFFGSVRAVMLQLLLPFVLGHLSRRWIAEWVAEHKKLIRFTDQSSILLVVYTAFSEAVLEGIWSRVGWSTLLVIAAVSCAMLALVLLATTYSARLLGFDKEDEITIVFAGSKKSLANGVPMANILFPAPMVGMMVLPLMIFHQIQLMVCAVLAQRYAKRADG
ncbi:bile acid:sodium symporter family protein [Neisseria animaloris]|uniref:bile acid:sodium symporter family protein n=1 Tax=Neisseria animaloris TaxID=326522 RepID=UPI000D3431BE|nr:bile acid:sodium symporter family protein [Neisseria animaloris]